MTLTADGLTVVPLRRISSEYLLEGWLHYDEGSYRYYRFCPGPVRLVLHHAGEQEVRLHPDRSRRELDADPFWGTRNTGLPYSLSDVGAAQRAQDTFTEAAVVVHGEGPRPWKFKVHAALETVPAVEGDALTRAEAVAEADKVLSKFIVQDVHDDPVDLRAVAREIDALRTILAQLVYEFRDAPPLPSEDTVRIRARVDDVRVALRLLGIRCTDEQAAK